MKVFPLKKAYPFAEAKGLGSEVARIKALKVTWTTKTPSSRMRRGEMIRLFEKHRILSEFIEKEWHDGLKPAERSYMKRCRQASDEYRQRSGMDRDGPAGAELGAEDSPAPPVVERPITPKVEAPLSPKREDFQPDIHQRLLERLQRLEPTQFEHLVGEFLKAKGITEIQVTGHSSDGGIDATGTIPFVNVKVAVQAKRYASGNNVGIEPVQRLRGSMASGYDRGIFITTSSFSAAARGWVEEAGVPITLVDGNELVSQMIELGLGIREKPVVETEVDEGFFGRLGA